MRLAILHADLPPEGSGGVAYQVDLLARTMTRRGHDVTVFTTRAATVEHSYGCVHVAPPRLGAVGKLLGSGFAYRRAPLSSFDVVHAHGDDWGVRFRPLVRTFHGTALNEALSATSVKRVAAQTFQYGLEQLSRLRATKTTAVSVSTCRFLPCIDTVISNAVDDEVFRPGGTRFPEPTALMVAGHLGGRKRGVIVLEAFRHLRETVPNAQLVIVSRDRIEGDGVRCEGAISQAKLAELYQRSWVLVSASSYEGFGLPYAEAMASGLPVIATPNSGSIEVLDGGRLGMLVDPRELAGAMKRVLENRPLAERYGREGLVAARKYAASQIAGRYEKVYEAAIRKEASRRRRRSAGGNPRR